MSPSKVRPLVLRITMRPHNSVLSAATRTAGGRAIVYGVYRKDSTVLTLVRCEPRSLKGYKKFVEVLDASPKVRNLQILQKSKRSCLMVVEKDSCEFYDYTLGLGRPILFPYVLKKGYRLFTLIVPPDVGLDDVKRNLERYGKIVDLKRISASEAMDWIRNIMIADELRSVLTPAQRRVVEVALKRGYYDWPRRIQLDELSRILGVSKATVSEHLRKSEYRVLSLLLS